jgi:hypothetical protein
MSEARHTPGPWIPGEQGATFGILAYNHADEREYFVAFVPNYFPYAQHANARLIAAAPTMYDRIKRLAESGDEEAKRIMEAINGGA